MDSDTINTLMCYGSFWLSCGLLAMYLYNKKGRSGLVGLVGGLILGPFGIVLALVSGKNKKVLAEKEQREIAVKITSGELKKCPHCAEIIKAEAKVCRFCGREV